MLVATADNIAAYIATKGLGVILPSQPHWTSLSFQPMETLLTGAVILISWNTN
jgi:hypothetical protein